ncbi:MAG TPA: beta-galactosidase [Candidatus Cybelea sp.]|jgi:endo-1,4-beta-mannosidase|nr:beta-galactosidase [Candidatus Cybelea sp.]
MSRFLLGINYWPRRSAMYMWKRFDIDEIAEDMIRIKELGLDVVRFFLMWEAFQPAPNAMDGDTLRRFDAVMARIDDAGLRAMPTLFCGHMSGVNWLPAWTLERETTIGRFRTIANDAVVDRTIGDFYTDPGLLRAQTLFARRVGERVRDHPALFAWDLGNEFSNLRQPETPQDAARWSTRLTDALLESSGVGATGGMHGEDLDHDRNLRPSSIAAPWPFATMHGYSVYSAFARDRLDTNVVPFLCQLQQSFSGKDVLFTEFGNPECPPGSSRVDGFACLDDIEMAQYASGAIDRLHARGALGAFWWCWADYDLALSALPPFDRAPHELRFGVVRSDASLKPVAKVLSDVARQARSVKQLLPPIAAEAEHYAGLPQSIEREYEAYCEANA